MIDFNQYGFTSLKEHNIKAKQLETNWWFFRVEIIDFGECLLFCRFCLYVMFVPHVLLSWFFVRMQHFGVGGHYCPYNNWLDAILDFLGIKSSTLQLS